MGPFHTHLPLYFSGWLSALILHPNHSQRHEEPLLAGDTDPPADGPSPVLL